MDLQDVGNLYPSSRLMFANSADGLTWSAQSLVQALPGVTPELALVTTGNVVLLVLLQIDDGPASEICHLKTAEWNGATFDALSSLGSNLFVQAFTVAGGNGPAAPSARIAVLNNQEQIQTYAWNGTTFSGPGVASTTGAGALSLSCDTNGVFVLASADAGGGIRLQSCTNGGAWVSMGLFAESAQPLETVVTPFIDVTDTLLLLTWIEASGSPAIWYQLIDALGVPMGRPVNLTLNALGRYSDLSVLPCTNSDARVLAFFTASPTSLREFTITLGGSGNDQDGDQFNDVQEMLIVDADPNDAVRSIHD